MKELMTEEEHLYWESKAEDMQEGMERLAVELLKRGVDWEIIGPAFHNIKLFVVTYEDLVKRKNNNDYKKRKN